MQAAVPAQPISPRTRRRSPWQHRALLLLPLAWAPVAAGQEWIEFVDESCRVTGAGSVMDDFPCNAQSCTDSIMAACVPLHPCFPDCDFQCLCGSPYGVGCDPCTPECLADKKPQWCGACEKDGAVGDFDGDRDSDDLVIVRKMPIYLPGGASNFLLLNEDKIMVDRTALVGGPMGGFEVETQDRDVAVADLNGDDFDDIVTAATRGDPPRVYINDGCAPGCGGPACIGGGNWCGLTHQPTFLDLDTFFCGLDGNGDPIPCGQPFFCGVAAGDLNDDGCPDLYFVDYPKGQQTRLHDRLMINVKEGAVCTGRFVDETIARVRCDENDCLYESVTAGIGVQILDMNDDGCPDILKTQDKKVSILLHTKDQNGCTGQFDTRQVISQDEDEYMAGAGDFNDDQQPDVFIGTDGQDRFFVNQGSGVFGPPQFPEDTAVSGNVLLEDLDGDLFDDVLLSSIDISIPQFNFPLGFLHTSVDAMDPLIVTIGERVDGPKSAYDAIPLDIDEDGLLDVWTGTCLGSKLLIQGAVSQDCDQDGNPDACEVAGGARDCNTDAVPDECCIEDMDFDGQVNPVDLGIVQANLSCLPGVDPCSQCSRSDIDGDGQVNPVDVGLVQAALGICGSLSPFGGGGDDPPPMMPWQYLRADLRFELRPVGGGDPVQVLAPNTEYEVYYTAGHDRVNGFALYGIGLGEDQGIADATPPARGPWSDTWNDIYVHLKRGPGRRVPAYGYDETKFRNDLCANNLFPADPQRYAPPRGTIGSITTRGAGEVDLHLYMFWLDPQEQVLVLMESVKSFVVR